MKTIEDEALGYVISNGGNKPETFTDEQIGRLHGYIDGANSKYVQRQIIEAKIEGLQLASQDAMGIVYRIMELEQQLKELGNE